MYEHQKQYTEGSDADGSTTGRQDYFTNAHSGTLPSQLHYSVTPAVFAQRPNGLRFSRREANAASEAVGWKRWLASET
jgi:hypothetical protein